MTWYWSFFALNLFFVSSSYRPDRDKYVKIQEHFIQEDEEHNFAKQRNSLTFGLPYDGLSIMHYESHYFSVDEDDPTKRTILSLVIVNLKRDAKKGHKFFTFYIQRYSF